MILLRQTTTPEPKPDAGRQWDRDTNSEVNLDIQYKQDDQTHQESQSDES